MGVHPAKDFSIVKFILEEDNDHIELIDIEFGRDGKPAVFFGKEKHPDNIIKQLDKAVFIDKPFSEIDESSSAKVDFKIFLDISHDRLIPEFLHYF